MRVAFKVSPALGWFESVVFSHLGQWNGVLESQDMLQLNGVSDLGVFEVLREFSLAYSDDYSRNQQGSVRPAAIRSSFNTHTFRSKDPKWFEDLTHKCTSRMSEYGSAKRA